MKLKLDVRLEGETVWLTQPLMAKLLLTTQQNIIHHILNIYEEELAPLQFASEPAVLLFHEDPDRFITGAFVKIGFFVSESDLAYHDEIHGSLFSQAHASHPYNPDVANAFFRSGEIESWGRGIEKIFSACRKAESPPPDIHVDGYGLWVEFVFSPQYMAVIEGKTENEKNNTQDSTTGEDQNRPGRLADGLVDGLAENQKKILQIAKDNPRISKREMAETIGISTTAIDKNIEKLKRMGLLKRVGSPKGGYWEVLV